MFYQVLGHKLQKGSADFKTIADFDKLLVNGLGLNAALVDIFPWTRYFGNCAIGFQQLIEGGKLARDFFNEKIQQSKVLMWISYN